jgi:hypothetical protein
MFYRWEKDFFENGAAVFEPRARRAIDGKDRKIAFREQKLQRKHEMLSELMEEHVKLKKSLGHRTVLNRLPYNQNGHVQDGCAPWWHGSRLTLDWSAWDRRFGPLLDGSAFSDLPRKNVPVECFYLPLRENWPSPVEGNYNGSY